MKLAFGPERAIAFLADEDRRLLLLIFIYLVLALLPVFLHDKPFVMHILIYSLIWASVGAAWDLAFGYAGVPTLGQIAFFAVGAYTSGILTKTLKISPWIGIIAGGTTAGFVGLLIGLPCVRLKGAYISLITFALHLILPTFIHHGNMLGTGGTTGLYNIPPLRLGTFVFSSIDKVPWYFVLLAMSFLVFVFIYMIINSSFGLAFTALRDSEEFARSLGVNEHKTKLMVFSVSAVITGIVGAFYAHYVGIISSKIMSFDSFLLVWVMMAIGGINRFPGVLIGAFIINFASEFLRGIESYRLLALGAIVVSAIILMPGGVMGLIDELFSFITSRISTNETREVRN